MKIARKCMGQRQCRKGTNINGATDKRFERSNNFVGSAGHKHNQKKINDQVGVDASHRLFRIKVMQNRIENDCVMMNFIEDLSYLFSLAINPSLNSL